MTAANEHMFEEVKPTFMANAAFMGGGTELEPLAAGAAVDGAAALAVVPKPLVVVGIGVVLITSRAKKVNSRS
jgi:hypothetical protein